MEIFFLDVGQATCQIILLGDRRAIVIDCGVKEDSLAVQFLKRMGVDQIVCLIVSHSHNDHIGGAPSVLSEYAGRIEKIFFVQDHQFLSSAFWLRITEQLKSGLLRSNQIVRLEFHQKPQKVWTDAKGEVTLRTFSPSAGENLLAQTAEEQNPTSAVLQLHAYGKKIIFTADSEINQWREIRDRSKKRLECDILAIPHHGGKMHTSLEDLDWFFANAVKTSLGVVSVGTSNNHKHPRNDLMTTLRESGASIMCTQITRRCHEDLESLRPGVLQPIKYLGRSTEATDLTDAGNSRNVACAGTIRVLVTATKFEVERFTEHQQAINKLPRGTKACPMCRK